METLRDYKPTIQYDATGQYYYVAPGQPPTFWLGTRELSMREAAKYKGATLEGAIIYVNSDYTDAYARHVMSFYLWELIPGESFRITDQDPLYKDYRSAQECYDNEEARTLDSASS